jgi:hypothetical protein
MVVQLGAGDMTTLIAQAVDAIPPSRRSKGGTNAILIEDFIASDDQFKWVKPERTYKDEVKMRKQVSSIYNTMKYHIKRLGVESVVSVTVSDWNVYLNKVQPNS